MVVGGWWCGGGGGDGGCQSWGINSVAVAVDVASMGDVT